MLQICQYKTTKNNDIIKDSKEPFVIPAGSTEAVPHEGGGS